MQRLFTIWGNSPSKSPMSQLSISTRLNDSVPLWETVYFLQWIGLGKMIVGFECIVEIVFMHIVCILIVVIRHVMKINDEKNGKELWLLSIFFKINTWPRLEWIFTTKQNGLVRDNGSKMDCPVCRALECYCWICMKRLHVSRKLPIPTLRQRHFEKKCPKCKKPFSKMDQFSMNLLKGIHWKCNGKELRLFKDLVIFPRLARFSFIGSLQKGSCWNVR